MTSAAALAVALLLWGGAKVFTDTTRVFHWTPGVWFMLLRVDCDREDGMEAEIVDPGGNVLCPLKVGNALAVMVTNRCDCMAFGLGPREGSHGSSFVSTSAWNPRRGHYLIRVKGLAPCTIRVSGGAQFSEKVYWGLADTLGLGVGRKYEWTARWGDVAPGDSSRTKVQRAGRPSMSR